MWGSGKGVAQLWISAPPALLTIVLLMVASAVAFVVSSAILAAGNAGVAAAALVAASAALIPVSLSAFADSIAPAEAKGIPRQAGKLPINTLGLPGPPVNTGGRGWATASVILAAGLLIQKFLNF
jgi:hypothetical protein